MWNRRVCGIGTPGAAGLQPVQPHARARLCPRDRKVKDFLGAGADGPAGLCATADVHACLICLTTIPELDVHGRQELFAHALAALASPHDLANQVHDVHKDQDGRIPAVVYDIPRDQDVTDAGAGTGHSAGAVPGHPHGVFTRRERPAGMGASQFPGRPARDFGCPAVNAERSGEGPLLRPSPPVFGLRKSARSRSAPASGRMLRLPRSVLATFTHPRYRPGDLDVAARSMMWRRDSWEDQVASAPDALSSPPSLVRIRGAPA